MKRCEGCGVLPSEPFAVWGATLCGACHAAWMTDDRFTCGAIDNFLGLRPPSQPSDIEQFCVEARRRTGMWMRERRSEPPRGELAMIDQARRTAGGGR